MIFIVCQILNEDKDSMLDKFLSTQLKEAKLLKDITDIKINTCFEEEL